MLLLVIFAAHVGGFGVPQSASSFEEQCPKIFCLHLFSWNNSTGGSKIVLKIMVLTYRCIIKRLDLTHRCLSHDLPLYNMAGSRNSLHYHTTESFFETANVSANSKPNKNCFRLFIRTPGAVVLQRKKSRDDKSRDTFLWIGHCLSSSTTRHLWRKWNSDFVRK